MSLVLLLGLMHYSGQFLDSASAVDPNVLICRHGGVMYESMGFYFCSCTEKFEGAECERPICEGSCLHGGRCEINPYGDHVCVCSSSFKGDNCEIPYCRPTCKNGGTCKSNGLFHSFCDCTERFSGPTCSSYITSKECPSSSYRHFLCGNECKTDEDCEGIKLCCWDGCAKQCMLPVSKTCKVDGEFYALGNKTIMNCKTCICQASGGWDCSPYKCPKIYCHDKVKRNNLCCEECAIQNVPAGYTNPAFINCPSQPISIRVGSKTDVANVTSNLRVKTYNSTELEVHYSTTSFKHCKCTRSSDNIHPLTAFSEVDSYGRYAECRFDIKVIDRYPPVVKSCPADKYAFQHENVTWQLPEATDNVGVTDYKLRAYQGNNTGHNLGYHMIAYDIYDYDDNYATCDFLIKVYSKESAKHMLPPELQRRLSDDLEIGDLLPPIAAGAFALIIGIIMFMLVRSKSGIDPDSVMEDEEYEDEVVDLEYYALWGIPPPRRRKKKVEVVSEDSTGSDPPGYDDLSDESKKKTSDAMESHGKSCDSGDQETKQKNFAQSGGNENMTYVSETEPKEKY